MLPRDLHASDDGGPAVVTVDERRERELEKALRAAMDEVFRDDDRLRTFVTRRLPRTLDHMASAAARLDSRIDGVLEWARQNDGWSLLAQGLYLEFGHRASVRDAARLCCGGLPPAEAVGPHIVPKPHLLDMRWPVLDRKDLWRAILEMEERRRSNVLLVMGPTRSGKSFTTKLLRHAEEPFGLTLVTPKISASSGGATPLALARRILILLHLSPGDLFAQGPAGEAIDPEEVAHSLCGSLNKCPRRTWIAVDATRIGGASCFSEEMDVFLAAFADLVHESLQSSVRLVLIGVDETSSCNDRRYERCTLRHLCRSDVRELFEEVAIARGYGAPGSPAGAAQRAWEAFTERAPGDDASPLTVDEPLLDAICDIVARHLPEGAPA